MSNEQSLQVGRLRETLEAEAGIPDLEYDIVDPALPDFAKRAAEIFHRDGFCIVKVWQRISTRGYCRGVVPC